jgi:pimeloyl-ACP methyl ester carboxylesterase
LGFKKPEPIVREGRPDLPCFVFIHGLGMNEDIWLSPGEARMMGGLLPMSILLRGFENPATLFHDVSMAGATAVTWCQQRPVGPVEVAIRELDIVLEEASGLPSTEIVLVGHSRGGLIARAAAALKNNTLNPRVTGLVTICSPHSGSGLAHWATKLGPSARAIKERLPEDESSAIFSALDRSLGFISSTGAEELLPGSDFLRSLPEDLPERVSCYSSGGTDPSLLQVSWLSMPEGLAKLLPEGTIPDELRKERGDGLVTARSAVHPGALKHMDFECNHLSVLVDKKVRDTFMGIFRTEFGLT